MEVIMRVQEKKQYRTKVQFDEIIDSLTNSEHSETCRLIIEGSFYAHDIMHYIDEQYFFDDEYTLTRLEYHALLEAIEEVTRARCPQ